VLWERGRSLLCQAFKGGSQGVVSEASALTRWFEKCPLPHYARPPRRFAPPTARVPRAHDLRFFAWSSDHAVDACRWRVQQLRGPPALRFLKRARSWAGLPGATVRVLDTGVSRSTCTWAPPLAHLLPRGRTTIVATEKTLTRRCLVRRTMTKTAKDQKTSSRAPAGEEGRYAHVSSARLRAEQEDNGQKTAYRPRYPR
jgi:hypothetical protein